MFYGIGGAKFSKILRNFQKTVERVTRTLRIEAQGAEPVFPKKDQAIDYAQTRACFRSGEVRILDSHGNVERVIPFDDTNRKLLKWP